MNAACRIVIAWVRRLDTRFHLSLLRSASRSIRVICLCIIASLFAVHVESLADARPGSGHSYRGSSRRGSSHRSSSRSSRSVSSHKTSSRSSRIGSNSGSSGGEFSASFVLFNPLSLCVFFVFGLIIYGSYARRSRKDWIAGVFEQTVSLDAIRNIDPNFSTVLFEDFLYSLYGEVQRARGGNKLDMVSAYLSESAMAYLRKRSTAAEVFNVIVGSMKIVFVSATDPSSSTVKVCVVFEANYSTKSLTGDITSCYVEEKWTLSRSRGVQSRMPGQTNVLACPACGAPQGSVIAGTCTHCNTVVNNGDFDWTVLSADLSKFEPHGPTLTSNSEERGTNLPTIYDAGLKAASEALAAKDPELRWKDFISRVHMIFSEFQIAWSSRDLKSMRPFLSDCMFQTQTYFVEAYKLQRLRNITDRAKITRIDLAKISMDRFYDAITIRLWASSLDYTIDDDNQFVCGSLTKVRDFSEYWTFIRSSERKSNSKASKTCPNCGAALNVNMAGHCEYCSVKVTSGAFDWVLSKIEQDDSYGG